jgi:hypothetical protein
VEVKSICIVFSSEPGNLTAISELFGQISVNIRALCMINNGKEAIFRFIVDDHERALNALKARGIRFEEKEVIACEVPDHPGGLNAILKPLKDASINILYLYPFIGRYKNNAILIFEVDDIERAEKVLSENWVHIIGRELHSL